MPETIPETVPETIVVFVNDRAVEVPRGAVAASACLIAGVPCRIAKDGKGRTALCGMGICFECRAIVDGVPHSRTCQILSQPGMRIETQR